MAYKTSTILANIFFLSTSLHFLVHFFSKPILGNPYGLPIVFMSKAFKKSGLRKQHIEFSPFTKRFANFMHLHKNHCFFMA